MQIYKPIRAKKKFNLLVLILLAVFFDRVDEGLEHEDDGGRSVVCGDVVDPAG